MTLFYTLVVSGIGLAVTSCIAYLLLLLCAAAYGRGTTQDGARAQEAAANAPPTPRLKVVVVVPAHNEERVLAATLDSLSLQDYPGRLLETVVVADNCTDSTAQIARDYGATILERRHAEERGKGYALDWAISRLLARSEPPDAVVIVDADTWVAPDFVGIMAARLDAYRDSEGCCALQGRYGVLNRSERWRSALMSGAFDLVNHIRPLGCDRLGLGITLKGNGMAFTREVLQRVRWQGARLTEDLDYSLDLLRLHGIRVRYIPHARVLAQMPVTAGQAASQRERWERGRSHLLRERGLPLLAEGLRRRNGALFHAGIALFVPPLAELAALLLLWGALIAIGVTTRPLLYGALVFAALFALSLLGFMIYVLGGLQVAGAPRDVYVALLKAPFFIVWKLALSATGFLRRRKRVSTSPLEWIRTDRAAIVTPSSTASQPDSTSQERPT